MKIPYPQNCSKSIVPDVYINQMKNALKTIEYGSATIGPRKMQEVFEKNSDNTGYMHCMFGDLIKNKVIQDFNTIKDGLELLKFYKSNNKYFTAFDNDLEELSLLLEEQNKTKSFTSEFKITFERSILKDKEFNLLKNRKDWYVYFNGETLSEKGNTLNKAIEWAKVNMFYKQYRTVEIKYQNKGL